MHEQAVFRQSHRPLTYWSCAPVIIRACITPSGARSVKISMNDLSARRCARRINSGSGLEGSDRS